MDSISPFLAALLVLMPFFFHSLFSSIRVVYFASLGLALVTLFGLGIFLGKISKENLIMSGAKTVVAGVASILISSLMSGSA